MVYKKLGKLHKTPVDNEFGSTCVHLGCKIYLKSIMVTARTCNVESTNELKCYLVITDNTYSSETHFIDIIHYNEFIGIDKTRIMGLDHGPDHTQIRSKNRSRKERLIIIMVC